MEAHLARNKPREADGDFARSYALGDAFTSCPVVNSSELPDSFAIPCERFEHCMA